MRICVNVGRMEEKRNSYRVLERKPEFPLFEHTEMCVCVCVRACVRVCDLDVRIEVFIELVNTAETNSQLRGTDVFTEQGTSNIH
jgi:Fe-S oxidoreductase